MSTHQTSEAIKQECIEIMGHELGSLYHALWNELTWLYSNWSEYVELYGTKPSRIDILNKAASHFFFIVQQALWKDTLLHISRLTDSIQTCGKNNLTIKKLPDLVAENLLNEQLQLLIHIAEDNSAFCLDWRNRNIAHKDYDLSMNNETTPLKNATRAKVTTALQSIADVLNAVSGHYFDSETHFEGVGVTNGSLSLLYVLDDGLRADEERKERRKAGKNTRTYSLIPEL